MSDEFNTNGAPDSNLWLYDTARGPFNDGWGNSELEFYSSRPANVKVENGNLEITARQASYMGSQYTSARITPRGKFAQAYGRY